MGDWIRANLPGALLQAQRKIERWRQRHRPRARIPAELWREAARLAGVHGLHRTAQAMRLDYYALKKHAAVAESGEPVPGFVEVLPGGLPALAPECTIELEEASGAKMRIRLQGSGNLPDVADLTRAFREGGS